VTVQISGYQDGPLAVFSDADIRYSQAINNNMHNIVDDNEQPTGHPGLGSRIKAGFGAFGPGAAARPGTILDPNDVSRQMPAIDDKMCAKYYGERIRVLSNKKKRQNVKYTMHKRWEPTLEFFRRHPFALQQVVAHSVSDKLISCKHQYSLIERIRWMISVKGDNV
jgi:hypothetical protein